VSCAEEGITVNIRFEPGQIVATPGVLEALAVSGQTADFFLAKHLNGDWGDIDAEDRAANEQALVDGSRILSVYKTLKGVRLWLITEAEDDNGQRTSTCILLPDEY
jgi:hypothetical protein